MFKKSLILLALISLIIPVYATISNFSVSPNVRMGENLTISGDYNSSGELCKFLVRTVDTGGTDANIVVERLSDEFTFDDYSFYSQRQITEPPYYRGDDYNVAVTCGSSHAWATFTVEQPVSLAHPIQKTWEYGFDQGNQDAIMIFFSFIMLVVLVLVVPAFVYKRFKNAG